MGLLPLFTLASPLLLPFLSSSLGKPLSLLESVLLVGLAGYALRSLRIFYHERALAVSARAKGGYVAPLVPHRLPFGIDLFFQRLNNIRNGVPEDAFSDLFDSVPGHRGILRLRMLGTESLITRHHPDIQHVLATGFANWGKNRQFLASFRPLLGEGVFASDQKGLWKWHRSVTRPHFARERVADMRAIEDHWSRVSKYLGSKARGGEVIDFQDVVGRFTLTAGTEHLFGIPVDSLNDLLNDRAVPEDAPDPAGFAVAFHNAQLAALRRMSLPNFVTVLLNNFRPDPATVKVMGVVDDLINAQAARAEKARIANDGSQGCDQEEPQNLVDHLMASTKDKQLIRHECLNILLAARDTTSSTLTSALFELGRNREQWNIVRSEVVRAFGEGEEGMKHALNLDAVRSLKYLRAVLNETLRLHPPVWSNSRQSFEDDVLPSGAFVPARTTCRFAIRDIQRDPAVWGADAADFVPLRWIDDRRRTIAKDPFTFQPFSAGPRICLGQQFAYTEMSVAMIRLLQQFKSISIDEESTDGREVPSVTSSFRSGVWVKFEL